MRWLFIDSHVYYGALIVLCLGILAGIAFQGRVERAALGNRLTAACVFAAILLSLFRYNAAFEINMMWISLAAGLIVGITGAYRVKMIEMPQTVAMLNGFGCAASAVIAGVTLFGRYTSNFEAVTAGIALCIGGLALSGSLIAAGKLHNVMSQKPVIWKHHQMLTMAPLILMLVVVAFMPLGVPSHTGLFVITLLVLSGFFGMAFSIRIGGADMPITISLLNSISGVAVATAGLTVSDPLLVVVGGIVGVAGLMLTKIMCQAMNRSLGDILLGNTSVAAEAEIKINEEMPGSEKSAPVFNKNPGQVLAEAKNVIIIPGYGMALAQAQSLVKELSDSLESNKVDVKYAIHPVAGRMPGHMNVLLAEADVSYDQLFEIDDINPMFSDCDVAIVVGANDVINPAANTATDTPIYGMPILNVENAKRIIMCNYDMQPGYAGVPNPLYEDEKTILILGDAKDSIKKLLSFGKEESENPKSSVDETAQTSSFAEESNQTAFRQDPKKALAEAKSVIIVPGYGMALAQAQSLVKRLADSLEENGADVKYAIHPVAGRMPGHMNVLLAEVDVSYDQLYEIDDINPMFENCDVALVVGANDVINPAANTATETPIYGMPILNVENARRIIMCNYDLQPGYAGVPNPLYEDEKTILMLGDAKESIGKLLNL